ncbi:MAG: heavy metal translocating P-type ATPase, partial [Bdellovibrionota bacterium]
MQSTLRTESCCQHCGLTVHGGAAFCCRGCESVHALLVEKGLTNFYSLRDQYSFRKPVPAPELSTLTAEQDLWASSDSDAKARFYIKGIHCLGCLWILEKLPELEPRIKSSSLDLTHNILEVEIQPGTMPWKEVLLLIASLGYSAKPIVNSEISELRRTDLRAQLGRIGVAAFCAGNIMLLSVSIYGGADPFWGIRFGWLSFFLALPVLTYSAWPIYKAAFYPLLKGMISVDLAIASAIVSGAMMSFWSLISGSESQIYFDSLSMLIFLLLSSRYLLAKFRENLAKESACLLFLAKHAYQRILPSVSRVSADEIEPGDELIIDCGQTLPVDGTLMGASAHFDFSLLSGESSPIKFLAGDSIEAGAILKDGRCRIRALLPAKESRLAKILAQITSYQMRRSPTVEFADSLGKYFVIATLSMAAALVYFIPGEEGARRALALVIVTCPCVLAFAIPLAFTRAMQLAARRGILFIAPEKLEALASIKHIYFDKTGTLTNGNFEVLKWQQLSGSIEESQRAAKSLENGSAHPVGKAINRFCKTPTDPVSHRVEVPGFGVRGEIAGQEWAIGKSLYPSYGKNEVELFRRGI